MIFYFHFIFSPPLFLFSSLEHAIRQYHICRAFMLLVAAQRCQRAAAKRALRSAALPLDFDYAIFDAATPRAYMLYSAALLRDTRYADATYMSARYDARVYCRHFMRALRRAASPPPPPPDRLPRHAAFWFWWHATIAFMPYSASSIRLKGVLVY